MNKSMTNGYFTYNTPHGEQTAHFSMNTMKVLKDDFNSSYRIEGEKLVSNDPVESFEALTRMVYAATKANTLEEGGIFEYNEYQVGLWVSQMLKEELDGMLEALNLSTKPIKPLGKPKRQKKARN